MAIKLEKINEDRKNNQLTFLIKEGSDIFANTIRRMILEEVPTLAVEDLEIKDNSSALYDEMLGLRLGLLPIKTDLSSYSLPKSEDEITEKSARCTMQIRLKAAKKGYVYAEEAESADPKCTFVHPKMPITKLLAKQKVDVTMTAVVGQGKKHVKWSPGLGFYKKEAVVKVGNVKNPENVAEQSTDGVFVLKNNKLHLVEEKVQDSLLLEHYAALDKGISVTYTDNIIFTVESFGQLSCKEMLTQASQMLIDKVEIMEKLL
ncbi:MAG: DNA-directed RNA polymerase subunit D [Nanoarchaeota archaeon]|nr:DNA-directed RNA polymerase subunit D [Nanoarchaeota archaeon]